MSNETKALKKIASAVPILGAPFVEENKAKRFVTDISKFTFGVLMMSLVKVIQNSQNQMEASSDMQMGNSTMESSESMSMNMLSISMFLVMYAQMRSGAMVGELNTELEELKEVVDQKKARVNLLYLQGK